MTSKRWNDIAYATTPCKLLTWVNGVWPFQVYNVSALIRWIFVTCYLSIMVILPCVEFQMGCTDAEQNVDCLMLICCGMLAIVKTIWFRIYADNLRDAYTALINDYLTIDNTKHRAIMKRYAFIGRMLSIFMVCFAFFACIIYALIPLLGENQSNQVNVTDEVVLEYTIPSRCALEYLRAPTSMNQIISLAESFAMILTSTCNHGNDALFLNVTLHVCCQVKILKSNFVNFDMASPQIHDRFNALIQRHDDLMKTAKKLADMISFILLVQFFITSILLCIMGFQLILALKIRDVVMMGKSCLVLISFLTQITVYSFVGDYLKTQMEEVGLFIYQSVWYNLPTKLSRNLTFIIMRSHTPVKLQAGNFIVVNLATYMSILKTSISYLSLLRVMVEI